MSRQGRLSKRPSRLPGARLTGARLTGSRRAGVRLTAAKRAAGAAAIALCLAAAAACAPPLPAPSWADVDRLVADRYPDVPQLTTARLAEMLGAGRRPVVLLDAREAEEYAVSHLPAAHHAPSLDAALRLVRESPPDAVVVAYCSVGVRSSALAARLRERGVAEVHNLQGSLFAWANEGRPVYRGGTRVVEVHPFDRHWGSLLDADLHAAPR